VNAGPEGAENRARPARRVSRLSLLSRALLACSSNLRSRLSDSLATLSAKRLADLGVFAADNEAVVKPAFPGWHVALEDTAEQAQQWHRCAGGDRSDEELGQHQKNERPGPAKLPALGRRWSATSPTHDVTEFTCVQTPSSDLPHWQMTCPRVAEPNFARFS
jgi:hypothetical protein